MKFVIQRVKSASVSIDENIYSSIDKGLLVFFCAEKGDESGLELGGKKLDLSNTLTWFAEKILKLRIFEDENGKMNRSVSDINGEILVVSQFTLAANCKKGTRPSFDSAMEPLSAKKAYEDFVLQLRKAADNGEVKSIQTGVFAADMKISLINDGPVTILL